LRSKKGRGDIARRGESLLAVGYLGKGLEERNQREGAKNRERSMGIERDEQGTMAASSEGRRRHK
jgi:hypothetical protein